MPIKCLPSVRRSITVAYAAACTTLATACAPESKPDDDLAKLPTFTLSNAPTFTLADDSTPDRSFTRISARRIPNGNVVVEDEPSRRITVFDRSGKVVRELTHQGSGPGEMDQSFRITSIGDTIFAMPVPMVMPASVFVADKGFIETYAPSASNYPQQLTPVARLSSRHWVVKQGAGFRRLLKAPQVGEMTSDSLTLGIITIGSTTDSATVQWLPTVLNSWSIGAPMSNPVPYPTMPSTFPFKGTVLSATSGTQLWFANAESGEIIAYDTSMSARVRDTLVIARKPFVAGEVAAAKAAELQNARVPFMTDLVNGRYDSKAMPATMPLFSALHAGDDGEIWIQLYEIAPTAAQNFIALSRDGKSLGKLTLPSRLRVQQFGRDFVLALRTDSLGLESVVEYSIKR